MIVDELQLLSGADINADNICTIRQPTLDEIRKLTMDNYDAYLSILLTEKDSFIKLLAETINSELIQLMTADDIHVFDLIMLFEDTRKLLSSALSFFICEKIQISANATFDIVSPDGDCIGSIDSRNYNKIRDIILRINCIKISRVENLTFKSEESRKRYMKLLEHREKLNKNKRQKSDSSQNLPNLIGAIAARSYSYNLLNIWQLTVYQLYDQFRRIHNNTVMDIAGAPILMFGGDGYKFDETFWFKNYEN